MFFLTLLFLGSFNFPKLEADKSLAIPLTPRQSGLFGVIDNSITFFPFFSPKNDFPIFVLCH